MFEWNLTKRYAPDVPKERHMLHWLMTWLLFWTYPQSVEQKYPPDYN